MAPDYRRLNEVIDSLDVRVARHARATSWMRDQTYVWRLYKEQWEPGKTEPMYVQLPGIGTFRLAVGSKAPYEFSLFNPLICDIRIWNPGRWDSKAAHQTGQIFLSFRSFFLQYYGLYAVRQVIAVLTALICDYDPENDGGPQYERIARLDLAVDMQEPREMRWADLDQFVCRSRVLDTWTSLAPHDLREMLDKKLLAQPLPMEFNPFTEDVQRMAAAAAACIADFTTAALHDLEQYGEANLTRVVTKNRKPQTIYFGRFGSELYARRYNKLGSLAVQNKLYMLQTWLEGGWDTQSPVIRTEFSLSGDFLRRFKMEQGSDTVEVDARDLHQLEQYIPSLWSYLTKKWLRFSVPTSAKNPQRWPLTDCWHEIQGAFDSRLVPTGFRDLSRSIPRSDLHLVQQARGCYVTTAALRFAAAPDSAPSDVIESIWQQSANQMLVPEFLDEVEDRMYELGLDAYTDTMLTTMFRQERMMQGYGS